MNHRTKLTIGFSLASAFLWSSGSAYAQLGGGSTGGATAGGGGAGAGGVGGGGGRTGGGGGGGAGGNQAGQGGSTQSGTIASDSILGSFQNTGTGRTTSALSQTNLFSNTYMNPYQQGLLISNGQNFTPISNSGFGQAVFGTIMTGGTGGAGGTTRSGFGTNAASMAGRSGTGTGFGGTSTGGMNSFGSTGATGRVGAAGGGFGGGMTGMTGGRAGTTGLGGTGTAFAGGNFGSSIGRTGPIIGSTLRFNTPVRLEVEHRADLQSIVNRAGTSISTPAGVNVGMNQGVVILRGNVATADEKRLVENMLRLHPGVREVRNELEVRGSNP